MLSTTNAIKTPAPEAVASSGIDYPGVTLEETEASLADFDAHMLKFLPYIYIPPDTTAIQLLAHRPFLMLCMCAISTRHVARQLQLFEIMRETLAQKLIVKPEPSIDLLLGLLTFLGW